MILRTNLSIQRSVRLALALALFASAALVGVSSLSTPTVEAAPGGRATRYVAVPPIRVFDSRDAGVLQAGRTIGLAPIDVDVRTAIEAAGVDPTKVDAVAINITAFNTAGPGFLTAWPDGTNQPKVSSLNFESAGSLVPNLSIVPLGDNGQISIFSLVQTDLTIDVQGVFEVADSSTSGRFVSITPDRAIDTRDTTPIPAGQSIVVDLTDQIPATASAAVLNVAVTETQGPGFLTVWEQGATRPQPAANVNYPSADFTVANNVLTGVNDGKVEIFSLAGTEVIVDVAGYMTGDSASDASAGLYVPLVPERLWDSRPNELPCDTPIIGAGGMQTLAVAGQLAVPDTGVAAVTMNLTMTGTLRPGFLEAFESGTTRPDPYSSVNSNRTGQTVGNHAVVAINNASIDLFSSGGTDFIADVTGYFLDETATTPVPPTNETVGIDPRPKPDVDPCTVPVPPLDNDFEYLLDAGQNQAFAPYFRNGRGYFGWRPCDVITYAVNVERATQVQVDAMNLAIRQVEDASGFNLVYVGEVPESPGSLNVNTIDRQVPGGQNAMALIAFSDSAATPDLGGATVGIGGIGGDDILELDTASNKGFVVGGGFALADINDVTTPSEITATVAHELGHMIGLDHVNAPGELMQPRLSAQTTFGNGDKNGLFSIGEPQCPGGARLEGNTATADAPSAPIYLQTPGWIVHDHDHGSGSYDD